MQRADEAPYRLFFQPKKILIVCDPIHASLGSLVIETKNRNEPTYFRTVTRSRGKHNSNTFMLSGKPNRRGRLSMIDLVHISLDQRFKNWKY
jgi:hypothetical protein